MPWKRLEDIFAGSLEDVLKISWRRLQNVLKMSWRRLEDVLKTSWRHMAETNILVLTKTSWRRLQDVFWRRKAKADIFVLIKTSWRCLEEVFWRRRRKTSSRRLHQDECLLDRFIKRDLETWYHTVTLKNQVTTSAHVSERLRRNSKNGPLWGPFPSNY